MSRVVHRKFVSRDDLRGTIPRIERRAPTRAIAVLDYIEQALDPVDGQERAWRQSKAAQVASRVHSEARRPRRGRKGHPTRKDRAAKRASWFRPDQDETHIREMARRWREERAARVGGGDGDIAGLLFVAAEEAARSITEHWGLDAREHEAALTHYFYGVWGESMHRFDPSAGPDETFAGFPSYLDWRARPTAGAAR